MPKYDVTNNTEKAAGITTAGGSVVIVNPKEKVSIDLSEDELNSIKSASVLSFKNHSAESEKSEESKESEQTKEPKAKK